METDIQILSAILEEEEDEDCADDELLDAAGITMAVALLTAEGQRQRRAERRQQTRKYLVRADLLPDPHQDTPWQILYARRSDRGFITTMGLDVATFDHILEAGFANTWMTTPIPRNDTSRSGDPRPGARSLDPPGALGLVLHYLNSTMLNVSLEQIFAIIPSTTSRYISFALDILLLTLRLAIPDAKISWLQPHEFQECSDLIIQRHPRLKGAFASIDGLNLAVQTSSSDEIENATFNGWLQEHFISSVLVFSPLGLAFSISNLFTAL